VPGSASGTHGVAGAQLRLLLDVGEAAVRRRPLDALAHGFALVADDDDEARATMVLRVAGGGGIALGDDGFAGGAQHMFEHGAAADGMRHLGKARLHTRPLAGGEDDGCDVHRLERLLLMCWALM